MNITSNETADISILDKEDMIVFRDLLYFAKKGINTIDETKGIYTHGYLKRMSDVSKLLRKFDNELESTDMYTLADSAPVSESNIKGR